MSETIGKASLRDAAIGTGVAVDKNAGLNWSTAEHEHRDHQYAEPARA